METARPSARRANVSATLALLSITFFGGGDMMIGSSWSTSHGSDLANGSLLEGALALTDLGWPVIVCLSVLLLAVATYLRGKVVSLAMVCWWLAIFGLNTELWQIVRLGWDLRLQLFALILGYAFFVWWFVLRESPAPGRAQAAAPHLPE